MCMFNFFSFFFFVKNKLILYVIITILSNSLCVYSYGFILKYNYLFNYLKFLGIFYFENSKLISNLYVGICQLSYKLILYIIITILSHSLCAYNYGFILKYSYLLNSLKFLGIFYFENFKLISNLYVGMWQLSYKLILYVVVIILSHSLCIYNYGFILKYNYLLNYLKILGIFYFENSKHISNLYVGMCQLSYKTINKNSKIIILCVLKFSYFISKYLINQNPLSYYKV